MSSILNLHDVTVLREGISLFAPLSLTLKQGESCEILGNNGIGKTSLLEAIAGLHKEVSGEISIPLSTLYLSTHPPFDRAETVNSNLSFWKEFWKTPDLHYQKALRDWQLENLLPFPYAHLSQGQKQRVNLARLSLKKATLWIIDEPTSYLDQHIVPLFKDHLKNHLRAGGLALMATHTTLGASKRVSLQSAYPLDKKAVA